MIKARVERGTDKKENVRILHVDVDPEMVKKYTDQAFHELRKEVTVPGFRKGRIPRMLFERHFGKEVIWEEALEKMLPEAYREAIEEMDLDPIAPPDIDLEDRDLEDGTFSFTAEIEVAPEVKLGQYKGLEVDLKVQEVTDEDVEETLHQVRDSRSAVTVVEDEDATLAPGMLAVLDFQGYANDEPVEELHGEEVLVEVGSGGNLPGFDEGILGGAAGESTSFPVELPADFPVKDLAGTDVRFEVDIKELKVKELPDLDDDFARDVFGEDSVDVLRENYREYMINDNEQTALRELEQQVIDRLVEDSELEVPEVMVAQVVAERISELKTQANNNDGSLLDLLRAQGLESEEQLKEELRGSAEKGIRQMLVLQAVADAEDIDVEQEELFAEIQQRAGSMGADPGAFLRSGFMQEIENEVRLTRTREFLASQSCPEYDEVKERLNARRERWEREAAERMAEKGLDDDSVKEDESGEEEAGGEE